MKFSIYGRMCLVLGFVFSFSACKDDDDDVPTPDGGGTVATYAIGGFL